MYNTGLALRSILTCAVVVFNQFDKDLMTKWNAAMIAGHFSYDLSQLKSRFVSGKTGYLLQVQRNCVHIIAYHSGDVGYLAIRVYGKLFHSVIVRHVFVKIFHFCFACILSNT